MRSICFLFISCLWVSAAANGLSIRHYGVSPSNSPEQNKLNLQKAIDSMSLIGGQLFVDASDSTYHIAGGIILRQNVSLVGENAATPRGTAHATKHQPVGSVFEITDRQNVFMTVESSTQISGIQFWYSEQTMKDASQIIEYPATIRVSQDKAAQGVTLRDLTFYGEYIAMDFGATEKQVCELITIEHCFGYPLSGIFIRIDHCYDIPRILHCHVNPAISRHFAGDLPPQIVDKVISKKTYAYSIDHTDNAELIDIFAFGTYGGIYLGAECYGQLTNFNFDCVAIGIHKLGNNDFNRNWQIAQGSIIANTGDVQENIHPIWIEGKGHTSITNVESFSGKNGALTAIGKSFDFMQVTGNHKCTISLIGCRMRNYTSGQPLTIKNRNALIQVVACVDKNEEAFILK